MEAVIQKLRRNHRQALYSSERAVVREHVDVDMTGYDTDFGIPAVRESAASRLQKRHEQSSRAPSKHTTSEVHPAPAFEAESFPLLVEASTIECDGESLDRSDNGTYSLESSYARVVKDSDGSLNDQDASFARYRYGHDSSSPDEPDREWVILEHRYSTDEQSSYDSIDPSPPAVVVGRPPTRRSALHEQEGYGRTHDNYGHPGHPSNPLRPAVLEGAPRFVTAKRVADRHRRKALPEEWVPESDDDQRRRHTPGCTTSHSPSAGTTHTGTGISTAPALRIPPRGSHKARVLTYDDDHEQTSIRHDQPAKKSARALTHAKSHSNLIASSNNTVGRKSTFASPTAASKQRSAISTKSGNSSNPVKSMNTSRPRGEQDQRAAENRSPGQKPAARRYADPNSEATSKHPDFFGGAESNLHQFLSDRRDTFHDASAGEFIAGRYKSPPTLRSRPSSHALRGRMMPDKHAKIEFPYPAPLQARAASPLSTSKIPRLTRKASTPPAALTIISSPLTAIRMTHKTLEHTKQAEPDGDASHVPPPHMRCSVSEQPRVRTPTHLGDEIPPTPLTGERAALLQPVVRRLSSAESQRLIRSRSNTFSESVSSTTTTSPVKENEREASSIQPSQGVGEATVSDQPNVYTATAETDTQISSAPCSPKTQPTSTVVSPTRPASTSRFSAPQQTAVDDSKHQERERKETIPAQDTRPASPVVGQGSDEPLLHKKSTASLAEQDPAIIAISPAVSAVSVEQGSRASSLRATASEFIPRSSSLTPTQQQLAVMAQPTVVNRVPGQSPITPVEQQIPFPTSPPCTDRAASVTNGDWLALTAEERRNILVKRHQRGSSDETASGLSNLTFGSALSSTQSFASASPDKPTRHFDWFSASSNGEAVRFARAPFPSMDDGVEAEDSTHERGWGIGSAVPGWRTYGWRGGDGLEISFVGHGPDAERFPDAPIEFRNYKKKTASQRNLASSQQTPTHNSFDEGGHDVPSDKKMSEWATTMGYKRAPCGDFEVTHAFEHVSTRESREFIDGWCNKCVPPHY